MPDITETFEVTTQAQWLERQVPREFATRLQNLVKQSAAKKQFGNWDDSVRAPR